MKRNAIITLCFTLISLLSLAQDDKSFHYIIETLDGEIQQDVFYPLGTTYHVKINDELKSTVYNKSSVVYIGDVELKIYPSYKNEGESDLTIIEGKKLTIFYYDSGTKEAEIYKDEDLQVENEGRAVDPEFSLQVEVEIQDAFNMYPNPTSGTVNIDLSMVKSKSIEVLMYNLNGEKVRAWDLSKDSLEIISFDTSLMDSGIYFVKVISGPTLVLTKKLSVL